MKATKLIEALSKKLEEHGDYDVWFRPPLQHTTDRHVFSIDNLNEDLLGICRMLILEERKI